MRDPKTWALVALYLAAIVAANLIVNAHGAWITPYVAFGLIGCDLTVRDRLHDRLGGLRRWAAIAALIAAGGLLTLLLNSGAHKVVEASVIAFVAAGVVDTLVYQALRWTPVDVRVNGSNVFSAAADSVLFLWIAFGIVNGITWTQFCAKVAGGVVWLMVLRAGSIREQARLQRSIAATATEGRLRPVEETAA